MPRLNATTIAEIGTWREFPPQSALRRTMAALADLDDRLLRDIGVTAYDAALEAGKPFWR